jgi:isoquinoline 1-oxidoreductase beta subunit
MSPSSITRRHFLTLCASAAGGLLTALYLDASEPAAAQPPPSAPPASPPAAFVHVHPDNRVVIVVNRIELGQGVHTSLPLILAEEMDADWSRVTAELAPAGDAYRDPLYHIQMVGGSGSIAHSFTQYRDLGARARAMLVAAAAARWNVSPAQCHTAASVVHGPDGRSATYGELADSAAHQAVPATVALKQPADFKLVGTRVPRLDSRAKSTGAQRYGMDVTFPGMKVALVAHPPVFGASVKHWDEAAARAVPGVTDVFEIPLVRGSGVAVVADKFWAAKQGRDRLNVQWDLSGVEHADSDKLWAHYHELASKPGNVSVSRGDAQAIGHVPAAQRIVAAFEFPFLAHACMEPLNCTVRFEGDKAEAWVGSQFQTMDRIAVAETLGLPPEQVTLHTEMAGGGFGRRATIDSHIPREAAQIAKRFKGTPVKLIYTREDDMTSGYYRPMCLHRVELGVGADGLPSAWRHVIVCQSLVEGTPFAKMMIHNGVDGTAVEGVADTHYDVKNFHVEAHHPKPNVPVLWWRSVGHTHTAFVMETLIDELAVRAKMDPFAYRRKLLRAGDESKKLRAALDLLDQKSGWRHDLPAGHAVGVACHESFGTGVACAVEVSLAEGRPRIHRATYAVDCGLAVNPLSIESQCQAGAAFGLTQMMARGAITLKDGRVEQSNFDGFAPAYIMDAPMALDVHVIPSTDAPTGCGEPPVPVISPAVANALSRLTGKRVRRLPLA